MPTRVSPRITSSAPTDLSAMVWMATRTGSSGPMAKTSTGFAASSSLTLAIVHPSVPAAMAIIRPGRAPRASLRARGLGFFGRRRFQPGGAAELAHLLLDPVGALRDVARRRLHAQ